MEEYVKFAIAKGLKSYGFSSHAPLPFPTAWNTNLDDFPYYQAEFYRLKEKYSSQIELFLGLEIDFINDVFNAKSNLYDTDNFDYKIGSIHYLDPLPEGGFFSVDGNFYNFEKGLHQIYEGDIRVAAERFFEISTLMIENGGFDIVGHVDKISLNGSKNPDFYIKDSWYVNSVEDILQLIKNKGLILEINTKSYLDKGFTYPDIQFFPLIHELDIPVVISSDCHYPDIITDGFEPVMNILIKSGFKTMQQLTTAGWQAVEFNDKGLIV